MMKRPDTPAEIKSFHKILHSDPAQYVHIVNTWLKETPNDPHLLFSRQLGWMRLNQPRKALADLDKVIEVDPDAISFMSRGGVHRHLGDYEKAKADYARAEALDPEEWEKGIVLGLLYQADCQARLGDEAAALACCSRLPDDFWTPGLEGTPSGTKAQATEKLRAIAAEARRRRS
jgi:tetratricopeptide (TPR) repeat protein